MKWTLRGAAKRLPLEEKKKKINCWYGNAFHLTFDLFIYGQQGLLVKMFKEYV